MAINTEYLERCIETLKKAANLIKNENENTVEYEMYRNALVKGFEMTLEQSGKLLKKRLLPYFSSKKSADTLTFKDIFRHALKHSLLSEEEVDRWFKYRDNKNNTAHDYGIAFAQKTVLLINDFIKDAEHLKDVIQND